MRYPNGQEVNETSMAAPTKRTTPRIKKLLDAVRLGQPYMRAAQVAGIDYETFRRWRSESRSFAESLEAATAEGELLWRPCWAGSNAASPTTGRAANG